MKYIDLNADIGESYGNFKVGEDEAILPLVSSINVACGFHAGDFMVMAECCKLAREYGVNLGAHPGYPDLWGFGRRSIPYTKEEITNMLLYQLGALSAFARAEGVKITHVKPHGALYNDAVVKVEVAEAVARAVWVFDAEIAIVTLPYGRLFEIASEMGLTVIREGFADRGYLPDGRLVPRNQEGAKKTGDEAVAQAIALAEGWVKAVDGTVIKAEVDTICVHGDNIEAVKLAQKINRELLNKNIYVQAWRKKRA
ncbi:5-oxoprolinase subunit PxpA [Carboxydothermus hydrogenoformans]|uniref:5-oxoprolinase subunit A n=1 Tax=Carboxydothermus hydrogenoformans (strain ATCC BAA-161 / DSM 6008 / Z-2901) TaxID=246194 RepID=PXPA_CARHZ|nr:5-oxoprolinase subunit PxpA [Carboxydothermus hydrogenoformans]Q3A9E0.1 RecName: Full=5-oxoprolinase subunit A; Short=5-OPase subunit A; AltName: Full=5-oxoprolinase (ATP-hydrolyzing) subunit A [Carboxydothermus hydrogenoformans Z-2901]ABB14508.1 LamB/YcsF family protein [Carboxydothermus hydrogenoformans Z-2901]